MFGFLKQLFRPRQQVEPYDLAQLLLEGFVDEIRVIYPPAGEDRVLDKQSAALYEGNTKLYQLAAVWMALDLEGKRNQEFLVVRQHVEDTVSASLPSEQSEHWAEVAGAAECLASLFAGVIPIRWAHAWLQSIGIEEFNPITCYLVAIQWVNFYIAVVHTLRAMAPTASRANGDRR
jgi:hypothetical protein